MMNTSCYHSELIDTNTNMVETNQHIEIIDTYKHKGKKYECRMRIVENMDILEKNIRNDQSILQRLYLDCRDEDRPKLMIVTMYLNDTIVNDSEMYKKYINCVRDESINIKIYDPDLPRLDGEVYTYHKVHKILRIVDNVDDDYFKIFVYDFFDSPDRRNIYVWKKDKNGKYVISLTNEDWEIYCNLNVDNIIPIKYGEHEGLTNEKLFKKRVRNYVNTSIESILLCVYDNVIHFCVDDFFEIKEIRFYKESYSYRIIFKGGHEIRALMIDNKYYVGKYYPKKSWTDYYDDDADDDCCDGYGLHYEKILTIYNILKKYQYTDMTSIYQILVNNGDYVIRSSTDEKIETKSASYISSRIETYDCRDLNSLYRLENRYNELVDDALFPKVEKLAYNKNLYNCSHKIQHQTSVDYVMKEINNEFWKYNIHSTDCIKRIEYYSKYVDQEYVPVDSWIVYLSNEHEDTIEAHARINSLMPDNMRRCVKYIDNTEPQEDDYDTYNFRVPLGDTTVLTDIHQVIPFIIKILKDNNIYSMRIVRRINFWENGNFNIEIINRNPYGHNYYIYPERYNGLRTRLIDEKEKYARVNQ